MHSCTGCICTTLSSVNFQMLSNCLPEQMHSRTGFPCMICFRSEISNVSSNCQLEQMQSRIGCIGLIFLKSGFSKVFSNCLPELIHSHIGCILTIFLQSEFSNVASKRLPQQMQSRIGYICFIFLLNEFSIVSSESTYAHSWIITLIASFLHSKQLDLSDGLWPSHHLTDVGKPSNMKGYPKTISKPSITKDVL